VSLGDQRVIPMGEAAMLEVGGNAENLPIGELETAKSGDHVLILRAGDVIRGRLVNIEGGEGSGQETESAPRIVTFKPNDAAERRVRFSEVRRLYFGNFPESLINRTSTTSSSAAADPEVPGAVRVPANAGWVSTGVTVTRRDRVQFSTQGQVQLSGDAEDKAGPAGSLRGRYAPGSPAPAVLAGALIGRIGNGPAFAIGDQTQALPMPGDGLLYLAVNDDQPGDNQGAFTVTVRATRSRR
jgi:hypothetical protein